jgi:hypothetical protein
MASNEEILRNFFSGYLGWLEGKLGYGSGDLAEREI